MMKNEVKNKDYLQRKPLRNQNVLWAQDSKNNVTIKIENTGFFNKVAQKIFKKPKTSYIYLDENGSFLWELADGEKTIIELGVLLKEEFGENAEPLYERLVKYFLILESYRFIEFRD